MTIPALIYDTIFLEHDTGEHVENKRRLTAVREAVLDCGLEVEWVTPAAAPRVAVTRIHEPAYVDTVRKLAEEGGGWLDWDTAVSPRSFNAALVAAGAGLTAVDRALEHGQRAFLLVRPPGHHALPARGMGFCLFNNVAIAAAYARAEKGLERIMIVDWDVHHGNGTQAAFVADPHVLFVSSHQAGHYPGTGRSREVGTGAGAGYTVNVPLQPGDGDGAVRLIFERLVEPLGRAFQPQLILVSAGYDAQAGDPLGGLRFSQAAYQWMAGRLSLLAEELGAAGPLCFLEGGYRPDLLAGSVVATLRGLGGELPQFEPVPSADEEADVRETLEELKPFWRSVL